jgi:hypothetical protein
MQVAAHFVLLAAVVVPSTSRAQFGARAASSGSLFEAGLASVTVDGYAKSPLMDVATSFWGTTGRASGLVEASAARFQSGNVTAYGEAHGALALSGHVRNLSALKFDGGAGSYRGRTSSRFVEGSLTLGRSSADGSSAFFVDAGVGAAGDSSRITTRASLGADLRATSATVGATVAFARVASARYADAAIDARWAPLRSESPQSARLVVGLTAGVRAAHHLPGRQAWLNGLVTLRINRMLSVVGCAGAQPSDPARGTPGAAFTSLALQVGFQASSVAQSSPGAGPPRATTVGTEVRGGRRVITVLLPGASAVELMGDFTGWMPVAMSLAAPGVWRARVRLSQGSHRANVKSDGDPWIPAPGLPVAADDFGGTVGILVVP